MSLSTIDRIELQCDGEKTYSAGGHNNWSDICRLKEECWITSILGAKHGGESCHRIQTTKEEKLLFYSWLFKEYWLQAQYGTRISSWQNTSP